jgi:hypothetical protein
MESAGRRATAEQVSPELAGCGPLISARHIGGAEPVESRSSPSPSSGLSQSALHTTSTRFDSPMKE